MKNSMMNLIQHNFEPNMFPKIIWLLNYDMTPEIGLFHKVNNHQALTITNGVMFVNVIHILLYTLIHICSEAFD